MTTPSPRMGLALPSQADRFNTADIRSNWEKLDEAPGSFICTSTTRPSWTVAQTGRKIFETNTGLEWVWTGTTWLRLTGGSGILRLSNGSPAIAERTTTFTTTSDTSVIVVGLPSVVVPAGNRPLLIMALWINADNTSGPYPVAIFRSNANNTGPILGLTAVAHHTHLAGGGGALSTFEREGLDAGTYDFSLQISRYSTIGGTSYMYAATNQPIQLTVIEL